MVRQALTLIFTVSLALGAAAGGAAAAQRCHGPDGKFIKCPPAAAASNKCRDITTKKFAKCGAPNTEPVPTKP